MQLTKELITQQEVIIYEGAFLYGNLFIRTDILVMSGKRVELIEVKAKSYDPEHDSFLKNYGEIAGSWRNYLSDVAFQKHVLSLALPECEISAYLMLVDKTFLCPIDGLNQKFRILKDKNNRKKVIAPEKLTPDSLDPPILTKVNVAVI